MVEGLEDHQELKYEYEMRSDRGQRKKKASWEGRQLLLIPSQLMLAAGSWQSRHPLG